MRELPEFLGRIEGSVESDSAFVSGPALWVDGKEILHPGEGHSYDVRLTRAVIRQMRIRLRSDPRVTLRSSASADWVEVTLGSAADEEFLVELVELAVAAHRPDDGTQGRQPPVGPELERRRRFH